MVFMFIDKEIPNSKELVTGGEFVLRIRIFLVEFFVTLSFRPLLLPVVTANEAELLDQNMLYLNKYNIICNFNFVFLKLTFNLINF